MRDGWRIGVAGYPRHIHKSIAPSVDGSGRDVAGTERRERNDHAAQRIAAEGVGVPHVHLFVSETGVKIPQQVLIIKLGQRDFGGEEKEGGGSQRIT